MKSDYYSEMLSDKSKEIERLKAGIANATGNMVAETGEIAHSIAEYIVSENNKKYQQGYQDGSNQHIRLSNIESLSSD